MRHGRFDGLARRPRDCNRPRRRQHDCRAAPAAGRAPAAIADLHGDDGWDGNRAGWVVDLLVPDRERFHGRTLEEALAWALVWPMVEELGVGPAA